MTGEATGEPTVGITEGAVMEEVMTGEATEGRVEQGLLRGDGMVNYKIVKHCGLCKKRLVFNKGQLQNYLCDKCRLIIKKSKKD